VTGLVVVGAVGTGLTVGRGHGSDARAAAPAGTSVAVARGAIAQAQSLPGTLGYGAATTVSGHGTGTVTWLPSSETVVGRGHQLYRVDDRPVVLLYGDLPLYRTLTDHPQPPGGDPADDSANGPGDAGSSDGAGKTGAPPSAPPAVPLLRGSDVDLLARNLAALGFYDGATAGTTYGWSLAHAVEEWQESLGEQPSGVVEPGDVVVAPGRVRVDGVSAHLGDDAQEPVLTVTSTTKVVTLQASAEVAASVKIGRRIGVRLPDGTTTATRITSIGTATAGDDGGPPSTPITVVPLHPKALAKVALGPVTARLVTASVKDALHVPVAALLALSGGGYAVQRTDGTLVPVTIGMVADGEVQVSGVAAGTEVVIAR